VNCLALGPKSGRIMVTGGEDRKVNIWTIGSPTVTMSLSGHTSGVDCVGFDESEDHVVAGSASGTIKLWNVEKAQVVRTLSGHKANISALDFHPFGKFVASGSHDTNVRLWDTRRQGCICTYKGHSGKINCLRFSPDGKWVVTGSDDGTVKLWDLGTSKVLHEFKHHTGPVNSLDFHPSEFLLASGSSDKTVKFWDLETFELVSTTNNEAKAVRKVVFNPDGQGVFSGAEDSLRVYGWEPSRVHDSLCIFWGKLADMTVTSNQLLGASFQHTNVSVWVVDICKLKPFNGDLTPLVEATEHVAEPAPPQEHAVQEPPAANAPFVPPPERKVVRTPPKPRKNLQHWEQKGPTQRGASPAEPNPTIAGLNKMSLLDNRPPSVTNEDDCLKGLGAGHRDLRNALETRLRNLQLVRTVWAKGDVKEALDTGLKLNDQSVTMDILSMIHGRPEIWDLHVCTIVLPALRSLFHSKHELHLLSACNTLKHIIRSFGQLIRDNMNAPPAGNIDISREERYKKCHACYQNISGISRELSRQASGQGKLGSAIREVIKLSEPFY